MAVAATDLAKWLLFTVLLGSVPLLAGAARLYVEGSLSLSSIIGQGDILLSISVICASSTGALVASDDSRKLWKILCGGCSLVILVLAAYLYQGFVIDVSALTADADGRRTDVVLSIIIVGLVSSAGSIALAAEA